MSARPGSKPKPGNPASAAPTRKSAAPKKPAATDPDEDNPLGVTGPVGRKAVALLPKPAKGRLHRVLCPMCETPGFTSPQAAGREVRCANPNCPMPLFTAPGATPDPVATTAAAEPEAPAKKGLTVVHYAVIGVVAAGIFGSGFLLIPDAPSPDDLSKPVNIPIAGGGNPGSPGTDTGSPSTSGDPSASPSGEKPGPAVVPAAPSVAEMRQQALELMMAASLSRDGNQRKPFCRRLAAEACAIAGDFGQFEEHLTQLDKVGPQLKYYRILPLVELAWQHLGRGDQAAAAQVVSRIEPLIPELPTFGSISLDTATELSTLLVALNRTDEATRLLQDRRDVAELGQLQTALARSQMLAAGSFDTVVALRPATGWTEPQWTAVTVGLTARGRSDAALAWARQATGSQTVVECISAWAETLLDASGPQALPQIREQVASLSPAGRAFVLSRCALTLHAGRHAGERDSQIELARAALAEAGTPAPLPFPDLKTVPRLTLPADEPLRMAALASAELAHVTSQAQTPEQGWSAMSVALSFTRAMAPSPSLAKQPFDEIARVGDQRVTADLRQLLNLLTDDDARNAYLSYRQRSQQLLDASNRVFDLQRQLLMAACHWGLSAQVWTEISERGKPKADPAIAEPWFESSVPGLIHAHLQAAGNEAAATEVQTLVGSEALRKFTLVRETIGLQADTLAREKTPTAVAQLLTQFGARTREEADKRWQEETILRLTSRYAAAGRDSETFAFVAAIRDEPTRETAWELAGRELTPHVPPQKVLRQAQSNTLIPPDRVALLRGFIERLPADPAPAGTAGSQASSAVQPEK